MTSARRGGAPQAELEDVWRGITRGVVSRAEVVAEVTWLLADVELECTPGLRNGAPPICRA